MYLIKKAEDDILNILKSMDMEDDVVLQKSNFGDYQYNGVMGLAQKYDKNPRDLASLIVKKMNGNRLYKEVTMAGPGFINISFSDEALVQYVNDIEKDFDLNIYKGENKTIFLDYGGANIAKELHVGHLRTANIGEALKRLLNSCGYKTISDVHLGDWGRPMGLVMEEIKLRMPSLPYFDEEFKGEYPKESPVTAQDLALIYPEASKKAKEDENYLEEAREITKKLQQKDPGITALWEHIVNTSLEEDIKPLYKLFNTTFDLWEGESDADKYIVEVLSYLENNGYTEISDGAEVIFVNENSDTKEIPPLMLKKQNGGVLYATTELATLYSRAKRFDFDEIWYLTDVRQKLHFTQVFRTVRKTKLIKDTIKLEHLTVGTMNGKDGKPFKTRDGNVMSLRKLFEEVKEECLTKISTNVNDEEKERIALACAVGAIKYADLLPNKQSDYIFDPVKFCDVNGKTGPYLLYSAVRIKSIFRKAKENNLSFDKYFNIKDEAERNIIIHLMGLEDVLKRAVNEKILNELCEYIFKLTNLYNTFYSNHYILSEENYETQSSWFVLSDIVLKTNLFILNILGIDVPDKM